MLLPQHFCYCTVYRIVMDFSFIFDNSRGGEMEFTGTWNSAENILQGPIVCKAPLRLKTRERENSLYLQMTVQLSKGKKSQTIFNVSS